MVVFGLFKFNGVCYVGEIVNMFFDFLSDMCYFKIKYFLEKQF